MVIIGKLDQDPVIDPLLVPHHSGVLEDNFSLIIVSPELNRSVLRVTIPDLTKSIRRGIH